MNDLVLDSFRHSTWATRRLVDVCRPLREEQLRATGVGTYGDIPTTLDHVVRSDTSYCRRVATVLGVDAGLDRYDSYRAEPERDLDELDVLAERTGRAWEAVLATEIDPEIVVPLDAGVRRCRLGIFFAQALNHANHHREQVCAILTGLGLEAPSIQAWEYGWATGRVWDTPGAATS
ncbi:hypothetical protein GC722_04075 [Auraticoccus sp. F435]|uniref:Damage-inducible protein DinB n=1 Tax=Auraticoccus cholistanensis TaxID=2656650 RepID=A0A6A9URC3_9ACTN|nr:hypothetical protein [Auraticoccus cholistanensis]